MPGNFFFFAFTCLFSVEAKKDKQFLLSPFSRIALRENVCPLRTEKKTASAFNRWKRNFLKKEKGSNRQQCLKTLCDLRIVPCVFIFRGRHHRAVHKHTDGVTDKGGGGGEKRRRRRNTKQVFLRRRRLPPIGNMRDGSNGAERRKRKQVLPTVNSSRSVGQKKLCIN